VIGTGHKKTLGPVLFAVLALAFSAFPAAARPPQEAGEPSQEAQLLRRVVFPGGDLAFVNDGGGRLTLLFPGGAMIFRRQAQGVRIAIYALGAEPWERTVNPKDEESLKDWVRAMAQTPSLRSALVGLSKLPQEELRRQLAGPLWAGSQCNEATVKALIALAEAVSVCGAMLDTLSAHFLPACWAAPINLFVAYDNELKVCGNISS
jgi:hypothetical protein